MLFNSLDFALFLPIVFALYWFVFQKNLKGQNALVLVASYVFYGWWDWSFLWLILFSTLINYFFAIGLGKYDKERTRKLILWSSVALNMGFLGFFKYYNFFLDNFIQAFSFFGNPITIRGLDIVLPVGISFYTFQTMSYTIDVYRKQLEPTKDFIAFSAYVSFFPQLVAGPIERAINLLPQFYIKRTFDYVKAVDGCRQILWGLFKKIVIADNCAEYANKIFENYQDYNGATLFLGAVFFAFQIYCDFSGYSDIATGTSRLFGFSLMQNFAFPYFSRDVAEFWRRWHISLSTWFRDYVYIPLGGSRVNKLKQVRNTFIIFLLSGFWHGANWTFVAWGALHALYFIPLLLRQKNRKNLSIVAENNLLPNLGELYSMLLTFTLTTLAWVFFRAETLGEAIKYNRVILNPFKWGFLEVRPWYFLFLIAIFIVLEWLGRKGAFALQYLVNTWKKPFRWMFYLSLVILTFWWSKESNEFIYFQF
jgi:D-alanyl-lipoteichoic acid acyltransferase DltB (MBOAT superfamily)